MFQRMIDDLVETEVQLRQKGIELVKGVKTDVAEKVKGAEEGLKVVAVEL